LAGILAANVTFATGEYDLVIPVPLDSPRLRWRGFNHACLLAAPVATRLGASLALRPLRRIRVTRPQASLPEAARRSNVRGAFAVTRPLEVTGRRVLLVDDVYTTGATVGECAAALRGAGTACVDVLTLARTVRS
jgi:ComF family protein